MRSLEDRFWEKVDKKGPDACDMMLVTPSLEQAVTSEPKE